MFKYITAGEKIRLETCLLKISLYKRNTMAWGEKMSGKNMAKRELIQNYISKKHIFEQK